MTVAFNEEAAPARTAENKNIPDSNPSSITKEFLKNGNFIKKSPHELEQECLHEMARNGFPFDGPLIVNDGKWHRYSCDHKKNQPDEWYIASSGISEKGNYWLSCTYTSWSGGTQKFHFKSWEKDKSAWTKDEYASLQKQWNEQREKAERLASEERCKSIEKAIQAWNSATEKPNKAQSYLDRKKVEAHGIRFSTKVFNDGTEEAPKFATYDTVLIPLRNIDGEVLAVQHIREDGKKRINGPKSGNFHLIGEITTSTPIYITEGYATGASVHEATNSPVIVAMDCGNLDSVIAAISKRFPNTSIIIAADDDTETEGNPGRKKAHDAAMKYGCRVIFPKFQEGFRLPNGDAPSDWNDLHVHFGLNAVQEQLSIIETSNSKTDQKTPPFSPGELIKALSDNECGDADLFIKLCNNDHLYDSDEKQFYVWDGTSWGVDKEKIRHQKMEVVANEFAKEAEHLSELHRDENDKVSKQIIKDLNGRSKALKTKRRMESVLDMATVGSIKNGGLTFIGRWDECPGFLPCTNGLVDLKTGVLRQSGRDQYIRKYSNVVWDENARCPLFERFVSDIMNDDKEAVMGLKRLLGYTSIGDPKEHKFVELYGPLGRNGKSTLIEILLKIFSHLAYVFKSALITLQKSQSSSEGARPDIMRLKDLRFAFMSEVREGGKIDTEMLKKLSGGDTVAGRKLYGDDVNFSPTHTLFLLTNHRLKAPSDDEALWKRMICIPFELSFVDDPDPSKPHERKKDADLGKKLKEELPGILRWIVEGAVEYHKYGLYIPEKWKVAVGEHRNENDGIGNFLKECCDLYPELSTKCSVVREAIKKFCESEGFTVPTKNEITQTLRSKGFAKYGRNDGDYWRGISLKREDHQQ